jgi:hypothetical protein
VQLSSKVGKDAHVYFFVDISTPTVVGRADNVSKNSRQSIKQKTAKLKKIYYKYCANPHLAHDTQTLREKKLKVKIYKILALRS